MRALPIIYILLCFFIRPSAYSQDQHFTQFYASALTLNPALTGAFDGGYRLSTIYRDQGRSFLGTPYATFSGAVDLRFPLKSNSNNKDAFGTGMIFYSDRNAAVNFYTNQMALTGAFHKSLSRKGDHFLSAGFQVGISQRNVNYDNFTFNDQFHNKEGYSYDTREVLPVNNFAFGEIGVGLHYTYAPSKKPGIYAGLSAVHLTEPSVSFYGDEAVAPENKLWRKYSAHVGFLLPIGNFVQFSPRGLVYMQGPHLAANAGANFRFLLNDNQGYALHVGSWLRPVRSLDNTYGLDAAVAMFGIEYNNFLIGMSYDLGLKNINSTGRKAGAFEISIAFLGNYSNQTILCPSF